jgi:hypothetical protein
VKLLCLVSPLLLGGCFNGGSTSILTGPTNSALVCDPTPPADGCPPCSTAEGAVCHDQWYSTGLRCGSDAQCGGSGSCQLGYCVLSDQDGNGLDDAFEREIAELNYPKVALAYQDECAVPRGVIYRARRHPQNPKRVAITYTVLYNRDCGEVNSHDGDTGTFAITVDLDAEPGAAATVGVTAWAHYGTICGSTSSCETEPGTNECATPKGGQEVVIYTARNKHQLYLSKSTCNGNCFDRCDDGERVVGPLLNVGEPDHPLVTDLTTQGFVKSADGWLHQLLHFNPWSSKSFAGGDQLGQRLIDHIAPPGK